MSGCPRPGDRIGLSCLLGTSMAEWNYPYPGYSYYSPGFPAPANAGDWKVDPASTSCVQALPSTTVSPTPASHELCTSRGDHQTGSESTSDVRRQFTYSLKVINPNKRSKFVVEKFRRFEKFKSPRELKLAILAECEDLVPDTTDLEVGYYKGRGSSKVWIKDEADLQSLYDNYTKDYEQEINIWCLGRGEDTDSAQNAAKKRKHDSTENSSSGSTSKRQAIRDEVEEIFATLQKKHGSTHTAAQLRLWANMLQIGTHRDYDEPPKVPMFGTTSKTGSKGSALTEALSSVAEGFMRALKSPGQHPSGCNSPTQTSSRSPLQEMGVSPGKCATLRTQYILQLKQLHQLLEATALTKEEYEAQKAAILQKMQEL